MFFKDSQISSFDLLCLLLKEFNLLKPLPIDTEFGIFNFIPFSEFFSDSVREKDS